MRSQINTVKSYAKYYLAIIIVLVFILMLTISMTRIYEFENYQIEIAQRATNVTSNGIAQLITEQIRQVKLLVHDQIDNLALFSENSDNNFIREKLTIHIESYFPNSSGFVVIKQDNKPLVEALDQRFALKCIAKSQLLLLKSAIEISLHPEPDNFHYDIMTDWGNKESGGFFIVSFNFNKIAKLLQYSQPHSQQLLLVEYDSDKNNNLSQEQSTRILASFQIANSNWQLLNLRSATLFSDYQQKVYLQFFVVMALFSIVLFVTLRIIFTEEKKRRLVEYQLRKSKDRLTAMNIELKRIAVTDVVTGISSRRSFDDRIKQEISRGRRYEQPLTVIMADIDHFKLYNDTYGHTKGDESLYQVAQGIRSVLKRPTDFVARYGGEEFVILLVNTPIAGAQIIAEDIRQAVINLNIPHCAGIERFVTISLGLSVACTPYSDVTTKLLVEQADQALYQAKDRGRNQVCIYQESSVVKALSG